MAKTDSPIAQERLLQAFELALERIRLAELALDGIGHKDERSLLVRNHLAGAFAEGFPIAVQTRQALGMDSVGLLH